MTPGDQLQHLHAPVEPVLLDPAVPDQLAALTWPVQLGCADRHTGGVGRPHAFQIAQRVLEELGEA